ncbi:MAG: PAS domain-containing protein [Deltaproteobacteria bacterium]|nr:PAS domain-containing protein [Deltaproteobacteria bacterium]
MHVSERSKPAGTTRVATNAEAEALRDELARLKVALQAGREQVERLERVLSQGPAMVYACRPAGDFGATFVTANVKEQLGYPAERFTEDAGFWLHRVHPADRPRVLHELTRLFAEGHHMHEYRFLCADGSYRWMRDELVLHRNEAGEPQELVGYWTDVTARKEAELAVAKLNAELEETVRARTASLEESRAALETQLAERNALLKEVHHRVKNNMQVVSSLLKLQYGRLEDPAQRAMLADTETRIRSMALVHELLYQNPELGRISLAEYARALVQQVSRSSGIDPRRIPVVVPEGVVLPIDAAVSVALLVSELLTNLVKHAFPAGTPVRAELVGWRQGSELHLLLRDWGVGLPEDLAVLEERSLGLRLVRSLARQLRGTVTLERGEGTTFHLCIPAAPLDEPAGLP